MISPDDALITSALLPPLHEVLPFFFIHIVVFVFEESNSYTAPPLADVDWKPLKRNDTDAVLLHWKWLGTVTREGSFLFTTPCSTTEGRSKLQDTGVGVGVAVPSSIGLHPSIRG
nr:hypothetical protein [Providencia sp.]